ncbi:siroheme synthase CysG [Acetobacter fabarum]|jgi:uroporphyrin-III C-methyltransferase/precorrin-2 dehydrogenase/sirohydrochlorin ferrochelatase|uniref:Uroporphyrinogen-III C-methyltransferase n=1 Tax=Acetobacter fabarum TaxID=483199 RepID=A0A269XXR8_9PROT|nr:siroheme synthase CysG [Acetobacter fabarum]MCI1243999.1 siroheme synthase CysG [Acetobacter fabarum]MCI1910009.1 siroheme synthase CysG [Acetobacter fabarum]MCI1928507.1 siroheme synthase CysG [Acetobacter fabarum]MCI1948475.1 siroheme synthase CysG [Acetobacter fabarum]MCI1989514.1 siroheme synthase CysG [Acetobacter fabarum]
MQASFEQTSWFPIMLHLEGARVLVAGGGNVAANKVQLLVPTGARVEILSPTLCPELERLVADGKAEVTRQDATVESLTARLPGCRMVYLATSNRALNAELSALCQSMNIPVCAVDAPEVSSFITPAMTTRGAVQIAVSTGGAAPVLARRLRAKIEEIMPAGLHRLAAFMQQSRLALRTRVPDSAIRRRVWEDFLDGTGGALAMAGNTQAARKELDRILDQDHARTGEVWLVGAGPGNPDLLTLAALRLMQDADSVLYDNLVGPDILNYVRRDAERVFVGKQTNNHTLPQDGINAELIRRAKAGERVLRLKGGDPFIFGRGGEEIEALMAAGVPFRIIPGISAANGCAAYAGIPLTHRDCAQACLFITGHARADGTLNLAWETIALRSQTIVIYMGLTLVAQLCARLVEHGLPADWPAAIVEGGTLPHQRVLSGTLSTLPQQVADNHITSPALIIVGQVVQHRVVSSAPA